MENYCRECGVMVPTGKTCQDNFHALLYREAEVGQLFPNYFATSDGQTAHFLAISCYAIQHAVSMGYSIEALLAARENMENHLSGKESIEAIRTKVRKSVDGKGRVLRRDKDPFHDWGVRQWSVTVADVLAAAPQDHTKITIHWAKATLDDIKRQGIKGSQ
jgi:Family of unknown function (DUF5946)